MTNSEQGESIGTKLLRDTIQQEVASFYPFRLQDHATLGEVRSDKGVLLGSRLFLP
jgi:hypothetical protein